MTALEILHENESKNTYDIIGIDEMKITIGSAECVVNMIRHVQGGHGSHIDEGGGTRGGSTTVGSELGTPPIYKLHLTCETSRNETKKLSTFRGYTGIYTKCTIYMFM